MSSSSYKTGDEEVLVEIQEAAERRLDAQLTTALAADQRALVFAGFAAAAAAALGGTAASLLAGPGGNARWLRRAITLAFATLILSALFLACCAWTHPPAAAAAASTGAPPSR
jgi:hypothetical protein